MSLGERKISRRGSRSKTVVRVRFPRTGGRSRTNGRERNSGRRTRRPCQGNRSYTYLFFGFHVAEAFLIFHARLRSLSLSLSRVADHHRIPIRDHFVRFRSPTHSSSTSRRPIPTSLSLASSHPGLVAFSLPSSKIRISRPGRGGTSCFAHRSTEERAYPGPISKRSLVRFH